MTQKTRLVRRTILFSLAMGVLAGCTASSTGATQAPATTSSTATAPAARILVGHFDDAGAAQRFVVNEDGSGKQPFFLADDFETRSVSPDGRHLAIVTANKDGVVVSGLASIDGSALRFFDAPASGLNLACGVWAPDDRLVCEGWDDADPSRSGLYTVRVTDGGNPVRLTNRHDVPCDFSPDGAQLAFVRTEGDGSTGTLMTMAPDGSDPRALLHDVAVSGVPCDWSPDGNTILTSAGGTLMLVTPEGDTAQLAGTGLDGYITNGLWSPDGTRILLTMALEGDQFDVYTVAADGSDLTKITHSPQVDEAWSWLP